MLVPVGKGAAIGPLVIGFLVLTACDGPQSALAPAGRGAERIANLFSWMVAGALIVWLFFISLTLYAVWVRPERHNHYYAKSLVIGGGVLLPTFVLAGLLAYGLALLPDLLRPAPEGSLKIAVSGEQWWWRIHYLLPDGNRVEIANELRLPINEPVEFQLESPDVIHSFWIPSLGGKTDMIPGRRTRLVLEATKAGTYRGICAEYCGESHALMGFDVVVLEKKEFARWLEKQLQPASPPANADAVRGQELFLANGCGACHTIRGTAAAGVVGPDLTHVGSRLALGASLLKTGPDNFSRWISHAEKLKPGVHMPSFNMLPKEEIQAMAAYLDSLK